MPILDRSTLTTPQQTAMHRWRTAAPSTFLWAEWDGDFIAFHGPSGRTHLLNPASELLLNRVLREPKTSVESATELATLQGIVATEEFVTSVASLLVHLDDLGLIEAA